MREDGFAGHLVALCTIFVWGTTFVSTKVLLRDFVPIEILFFRFLLGFCALALIYPRMTRLRERRHELLFMGAGLTGITLYFLLEKTELLSVVYILFSISQFSSEMINGGPVTQWMMLFALPLMLRYNGKKGPGLKYFFYFFYPAHTFFLFYLANFVFV